MPFHSTLTMLQHRETRPIATKLNDRHNHVLQGGCCRSSQNPAQIVVQKPDNRGNPMRCPIEIFNPWPHDRCFFCKFYHSVSLTFALFPDLHLLTSPSASSAAASQQRLKLIHCSSQSRRTIHDRKKKRRDWDRRLTSASSCSGRGSDADRCLWGRIEMTLTVLGIVTTVIRAIRRIRPLLSQVPEIFIFHLTPWL
jgi:hypothetical protein